MRSSVGKGYAERVLASGMVAPHGGKDRVDIQEVIRSAIAFGLALPTDR